MQDLLCSSQQVRDYLVLKLGRQLKEMFLVLFLDTQNRLIAGEKFLVVA